MAQDSSVGDPSVALPQSSRLAGARRRERLLLVGLASCDLGMAERLVVAGRMPALARLKAEGAWGRLTAEEPLLAPALWTTLATGRHPENHRVLVPYAPRPDGGGVARTGHAAWQAPAFWQVLEAAGRRSVTIGWPASWPAASWPGVHVDARIAAPTGPSFATWAMPPDCVLPETLRGALRAVRVHPSDVTGAMLAPFVPRLREVDQYRDARLAQLAVLLAGSSTIHAVATELVATEDRDVAVVHYDLLEHVHRGFDGVRDEAMWKDVVDAAYAFVDAMVGRLIELAGPDTTVWLVSPNGIRRDAAFLRVAPWRPVGFLAARGRWIEPGTELPPARLVDVAPSLLARFGLTSETDGRVLRALAPGLSRRPIAVPGPAIPGQAAREPDLHVAPLRALGYADAPTAEQAKALKRAENARLRALGEALLGRGRVRQAETVLRQALASGPAGDPTVLRRLALCRLVQGDADECLKLGAALREAAPQSGWGDLIIAAGFALEGKAEAAWPHMAAAREKSGHEPDLLARLGGIALMLKEDGSAIANFTRALALDPDLPAARHGLEMARQLGASYGRDGR